MTELCKDHSIAAQFLLDSLSKEEEEVVTNVDGKQFGRPLTKEGILAFYAEKENIRGIYGISSVYLFRDKETKEIIGHCSLSPVIKYHFDWNIKKDVDFFVGLVYVVPERRREGIATSMVKSVVSQKSPEHVLNLFVAKRNQDAIRFYKRCGFVKTDITIVNGGAEMALWKCF
eukprot:CAMPEP_0201490386 /NCGR_PEP_ID=MMETSP0151_2-20130828/26528_1 /ASSEMBLY_ACC=CAM_ASM_000257 /TAXON_ID=200890 /ORGANISM="Paramoeba atlantica, Strain 621/1 / CCAP 1560/9" /LENGTH=172 /DNA_ID=CAMNT_0047876349 /DNA_START=17 /DNA_END=535 /DNA_ORIENTATION=+